MSVQLKIRYYENQKHTIDGINCYQDDRWGSQVYELADDEFDWLNVDQQEDESFQAAAQRSVDELLNKPEFNIYRREHRHLDTCGKKIYEDNGQDFFESIAAPKPDDFDEQIDEWEQILGSHLTDQQVGIVISHAVLEERFAAIGARLNLKEATVRQIYNRATKKVAKVYGSLSHFRACRGY